MRRSKTYFQLEPGDGERVPTRGGMELSPVDWDHCEYSIEVGNYAGTPKDKSLGSAVAESPGGEKWRVRQGNGGYITGQGWDCTGSHRKPWGP